MTQTIYATPIYSLKIYVLFAILLCDQLGIKMCIFPRLSGQKTLSHDTALYDKEASGNQTHDNDESFDHYLL